MFSTRRGAVALIAAAGITCATQTAAADESGSFTAIGSMVHNYTTIEHAGGTVFGGFSEGTDTIIESTGDPFVAGSHSHVTCVVFGKRTAAGMELEAPCVSTAAGGDKLYLLPKRNAGDVEEGGGGGGVAELLGGTGKYAGMTGSCAYEVDYLVDDRYVIMTDCKWQNSAERN